MESWAKDFHVDPEAKKVSLKFFVNMEWHENQKKGP
jgi:hypothetical protein